MKRLSHSLLLLALSAAAALPAEWLFTRPKNAALYGGRHMEPTNAYSVLRREDVAWIEEAAAEREAMRGRSWTGLVDAVELVPQFGGWPLSESNRFERWVGAVRQGVAAYSFETNIAVGYGYATNRGAGADSARYELDHGRWLPALPGGTLDAGGDWLALDDAAYTPTNCVMTLDEDDGGVRLRRPWTGIAYTNVSTSVSTNYSPSALATNMTVFTKVLTNGVVTAHTNAWTEMLPQVSTNAATNVVGATWRGMMFTNFVVNAYEAARPDFGGRRFHLSNYTNYLHWLGGMTRLSDMAFPTNAAYSLYQYSTDIMGSHYDGYSYYTNSYGTLFGLRQERYTTVVAGYEGERWGTNEYGNVTYYPGRGRYEDRDEEWYEWSALFPLPSQAVFASGLTAAAVTNGGVNRVRRARIYACAEVSLDMDVIDSDFSGGAAVNHRQWTTNRAWRVVRHVGDASYLGAAPDGKALFSAALSYYDVCRSLLAVPGVPASSFGGYAVPLHPHYAPPGGGTADYSSSRHVSDAVDVEILDFILLYDFQWTTDLSGW